MLIAVLLLLMLSPVAQGTERCALVIGNADYTSSPLNNPVNDARDIAAALERIGFDVILKTDADRRQMMDGVDLFYKRLSKSKIGLFYYAGHGMQVRGENYLIPVKVRIKTETDIPYEAVHAGRILGKMETAANAMNIVILDACRDNPFKRSFRSQGQGLARMDAPPGTLIAYATSPGDVALDGDGRNGVYTKALLAHINKPNLDVQKLFNRTGLAVIKATKNSQVPWTSSTPFPEYYLASSGAVVDYPGTVTGTASAPKAWLSVESTVKGATVYLGSTYLGKTDIPKKEVRPGTHRISVEKSGYEAYTKTLALEPGRTKSLFVDLSLEMPKAANLFVDTDPDGARVRILNIAPVYFRGIDLEAGSYTIEVSAAEYDTKSFRVSLEAGEQKYLDISLKKKQTAYLTQGQTGSSSWKSLGSSAGAGPEPAAGTWTDPETGMEFVRVPGGCYQMGSNSGYSDEKPVHQVCLDGFWMAKTEVTQGQWSAIMGGNPSKNKSGNNYPVEKVSWNDARDFIQKLNQRSGKIFSLPTEAQWEYAARSGGKDETYSGSNSIDSVAWYEANSGKKTHSVGTKSPNGLGIYDMTGNVWEWCEDVYDKSAYSKHLKNNPVSTSGSSYRVLRGGSWSHDPWGCRAAARGWRAPSFRCSYGGFRLVLLSGQ